MSCCPVSEHEIDFDSLFNDDSDAQFFQSLCAQKIQELSKGVRTEVVENLHESESWGYLSEIGHEKEVMHLSTTLSRLIIHFYNPAFKSCQILNEHLQKIARKFPMTRFIYIDVTKAPFLVVKMKIQVLPCLVCIVDTIAMDRLVGFEDLGGTENFTTKQLEDRLASHSRIFQVPRRLKISADRRDNNNESDEDSS